MGTSTTLQSSWAAVNMGGFLLTVLLSSVLASTQAASVANIGCEFPYISIEGLEGCYRFYQEKAAFDVAKLKCAEEGANLIVMETEFENTEIQKHITHDGGIDHVWIDLTRVEDKWMWAGQVETTYTNWGWGEPNNLGLNEDCVEINQSKDGWNDETCDHEIFYICELQELEM